MRYAVALLAVVTLQRLGELIWGAQNTPRLLASGGIEFGANSIRRWLRCKRHGLSDYGTGVRITLPIRIRILRPIRLMAAAESDPYRTNIQPLSEVLRTSCDSIALRLIRAFDRK